jgi:signal transduction histidine kinase
MTRIVVVDAEREAGLLAGEHEVRAVAAGSLARAIGGRTTVVVAGDRALDATLRELGECNGALPVIAVLQAPGDAAAARRAGAFDAVPAGDAAALSWAVARALHGAELRAAHAALLSELAAIAAHGAQLAHDAKAPRGALQTALRAVAGKLGADPERVLGDFLGQLATLEAHLAGVLRLARPLEPGNGRVRVGALFAAVARAAARRPTTAHLPVCIDGDPGELTIAGSQDAWVEALCGLIDSAAEAGAQGSVELMACRSADGVRLEVRDAGPPPGPADEMFLPFGPRGTRRAGTGAAFCRKVADFSGGKIAVLVASAPDQGVTVQIELPGPGSGGGPS